MTLRLRLAGHLQAEYPVPKILKLCYNDSNTHFNNMALEDQRDENGKAEVSRPMDLSDALSLDDDTGDFNSQINAVAGNEMAEASSYEENLHDNVRTREGSAVERANTQLRDPESKRDQAIEVGDRLRRVEELINDLNQKALEHRTSSWWEKLPIIENVRYHNLATWEAETIDELHVEVESLRSRADKHGLNTADLDELLDKLKAIKSPGGAKKWLATLMPGFRTVHRGFRSHKFLRLRSRAGKLRKRMINEQSEPPVLAT